MKHPLTCIFWLICLVWIGGSQLAAIEPSFAEYFSTPFIYGTAPTSIRWCGKGLLFLWNNSGGQYRDIYLYSLQNNSVAALTTPMPATDKPGQNDKSAVNETGISQYVLAPNQKQVLFVNNGDIFAYAWSEKQVLPILHTADKKSEIDFTADGRGLYYLERGDLHRLDLASKKTAPITTLAKTDVAVDMYLPAGNDRYIALITIDATQLPMVSIPRFKGAEWTVQTQRRSIVGKGSRILKLGFYDCQQHTLTWAALGSEPWYFLGWGWLRKNDGLILGRQIGNAKHAQINVVRPTDGKALTLYREDNPQQWVDTLLPMVSGREDCVFFMSERSGWRQLWQISVAKPAWDAASAEDYREPRPLLPNAAFDIAGCRFVARTDDLILEAYAPNPATLQLFKFNLKKQTLVQISRDSGHYTAYPRADGKMTAVVYQNHATPPDLYLLNNSDLTAITKSPRANFKDIAKPAVDLIRIPAATTPFYARLYRPDPLRFAGKRPLIIADVYADRAKDRFWPWNLLAMWLANRGYLVAYLDLHGSLGYGRDFHLGLHQAIGDIDRRDILAAVTELTKNGWADEQHMGIWGWSYGGFLTLMALFKNPGVFQAGVAISPVTNWRNYNEWYTRQRLLLPEENQAGYAAASPIMAASSLQDKLLLLHGMLDDNVLCNDSLTLVQKLIAARKRVDTFFYPNDGHMIHAGDSATDLMLRVRDFLLREVGGTNHE